MGPQVSVGKFRCLALIFIVCPYVLTGDLAGAHLRLYSTRIANSICSRLQMRVLGAAGDCAPVGLMCSMSHISKCGRLVLLVYTLLGLTHHSRFRY